MNVNEPLRDVENLRFRIQMNNRLRLECLAAVSKVFREFNEPINDELLSSIVFALPQELLSGNGHGKAQGQVTADMSAAYSEQKLATGNPPEEPEEPGLPPQEPGLPPQEPGLPPQEPGLPPQEPGLPPQEPGLPPQEPGLPPQEPGLPPQEPGLPPESPEEAPALPPQSPEETPALPPVAPLRSAIA